MSFDTHLQELADASQPLAASKLAGLSNLETDQAARFTEVWLEMGPARRESLIETLIDLAEDNVELNFDAVFFVALADEEAGARRAAIRGLWEHEGRDLIDPLAGLLEGDGDAGVRAEAALALGRFVLQAELGRLPAAHAERVERALRRSVDDASEVSEVRGRALESLGALGRPWVSDLIRQAFASLERRLRLSALQAMGRSCDAAWLPTLLPELESDDAEARFEAAGALGAIANEAATPHLLPLLHDDDAEAQEAAIAALGQIGTKEAKEALNDLLIAGDERVREAATTALAEADFAEDPPGFMPSE